jgi:exodeoxyribonuclease VIII
MTGKVVYDMPEAEYRAAEGVSQSELKYLARSPAHYRAFKDGPKPEPTAAMVLGTVTHARLLQPGDPLGYFVRPAGMDFRSKEGKAWKESHGDLPIITEDEQDSIAGMIDAVAAHPAACAALSPPKAGSNEVSMFAIDGEDTGILRKGRADRITPDEYGNTVVVDLKTTDDASPAEFAKTVGNMRYHVQAAYYTDLAAACGMESPLFMFIAVEREAPFAVGCYVLSPEDIAVGRMTYRRELRLLKDCLAVGKWPAYGEGVQMIDLPRWMKGMAA